MVTAMMGLTRLDRLRELKSKIADQRKSLDDLEKHMYVIPCLPVYLPIWWMVLIDPVTT